MPYNELEYQFVVTPRLKELLAEKDFTQTEISRITGIDQSVISRFDHQSRHADIVLFKLAEALNCNIKDLFTVSRVRVGK
jgi:DNA-binding Xre family transcriptional regulator